ncbi:TlpA disulfide reductase family protein [Robbsia andropogonis]|uniref:TlpA disulfide reductase family protein n=1 Tax=Robbsia andropogonis TaxID=28092 RepID=UPI0009E29778|nr:TlpA disulfide reductase family protein [Robbsia andropogonis]
MSDPILSGAASGAGSLHAEGIVSEFVSMLIRQVSSIFAPEASFVVLGIPVTATLLQWIAAACLCMVLATLFARRKHTHVEPPLWWALILGGVAARVVYVARHWAAYIPDGSGDVGDVARSFAAADVWHAIGAMLDVRDGGMSVVTGLLCGSLVLVAAGWRRASLRAPLAATVCAAIIAWCGAGAALHAGAASRPALPNWTFADAQDAALMAVPLHGAPRQPTVVNLWATWCGPCRREMPALARVQAAYHGIHIVFANQGETVERVRAYLASTHLVLDNVLMDHDARLGEHYHSSVVPTTLFFHANGRFAAVHFGELSEPALRATLDQLQ